MDKEKIYDTLSPLIERFMAGETTLAQERQLYDIFARNKDLGPYERYRPMFVWYGGAAASASHKSPRRIWLRVAAAAIVFLAVGFAIFTGITRNAERNELYAQLQGSYVRVNGKTITDVSRIYDKLLSAEHTADSLENIMDMDYDELNETIARQAIADISDPEIAALISADLLGNDI